MKTKNTSFIIFALLIMTWRIYAGGPYHNEKCGLMATKWSCTDAQFYCTGSSLNQNYNCSPKTCTRYIGTCLYSKKYYDTCTEDNYATEKQQQSECKAFNEDFDDFEDEFNDAYAACMLANYLLPTSPIDLIQGAWGTVVNGIMALADHADCACSAFKSACDGCKLYGSEQDTKTDYGCVL